jgi:hypothetical protein
MPAGTTFTILGDVIAVKETVGSLRHGSAKPELPVDQRQEPLVFAVAESAPFHLVV